jgi:hypothetical protein
MFFPRSSDTHSISVADLIDPAADAAMVTQSHKVLGPLQCEVCDATTPGGVAVGVIVFEIAQTHPWILWVLPNGFSESDSDSKGPIAVCAAHQSHPAGREMRFDAALLAAHETASASLVALSTPEPPSVTLVAVAGDDVPRLCAECFADLLGNDPHEPTCSFSDMRCPMCRKPWDEHTPAECETCERERDGRCAACGRGQDEPHTADCTVALAQDAADNGHDYDPADESCKKCGGRGVDLDRACGTGPLCKEKTCHHFGRTMIDGGDGAWTCPPVLGLVCHKGHPMQATLTDDAEIDSDGTVTHAPGNVDRIYCAADCEDVPEEIIDAAKRIFDNDGADIPDEDAA